MMIAGLVRDDVRQAIIGFPGPVQDPGSRHAVPQPGLRPQRDRARHHRHAVSDAAGRAQRAGQAGRQFQRAERRRRHFPRTRQSRLRNHADRPRATAAITASSATSTNDRDRADEQDSVQDEHRTCPASSPGARMAPARVAARRGRIGSLLAGCAKRDSITVGAVPDDYRTNHPIVIAEKDAGARPAGRGRRPRHDAIAARLARRLPRQLRQERRAGGDHHRARRAPAMSSPRPTPPATIRHFCAPAAFLKSRIMMASYQAPSVDVSAPVRVSYTAMRAQTNKCGRWPDDLLDNVREQALRRISAAPIRTTLPHRSPIRPICSGRASRPRSTPRIAAVRHRRIPDRRVRRQFETRSRLLTVPRLGAQDNEQSGLRYRPRRQRRPRTAMPLRCRRCGRCRASRSRRSARPKASPIRSSAPATTAACPRRT